MAFIALRVRSSPDPHELRTSEMWFNSDNILSAYWSPTADALVMMLPGVATGMQQDPTTGELMPAIQPGQIQFKVTEEQARAFTEELRLKG